MLFKETNHATVAQSILKSVGNFNIKYEDIYTFASDNVAYMKKCFSEILKPLFKNCRHVTCVAHILALIGECWRNNLKDLDSFIGMIKQIFSKSAARRRRWLNHLRNNDVENPILPPSPVITRWNTWFKAAIYHSKHIQYYQSFVANERLFEDDTPTLEALDLLLERCVNFKDQVRDLLKLN